MRSKILTQPQCKTASTRMLSKTHQQGLTLLEVLIAMAITAVVGVMSYTGFSAATSAYEVSKEHMDNLNRLNLMFSVLSRDMQQLAARPIEDEFGDEQAALQGDDAKDVVLSLSRYGWINALDKPRSEMQRVDYRLEEGKLYRRSWYVLDRVSENESEEVILMQGVENIQLRFLDDSGRGDLGGEWQKTWPLLQSNDQEKLPLAVELEIELENWGVIRRVYEVAS